MISHKVSHNTEKRRKVRVLNMIDEGLIFWPLGYPRYVCFVLCFLPSVRQKIRALFMSVVKTAQNSIPHEVNLDVP